ncbi:MAG: OmpA family protein [Bacteroidetes bacterium]|nr:OmpA family protein [Bacteroidota bacterium]
MIVCLFRSVLICFCIIFWFVPVHGQTFQSDSLRHDSLPPLSVSRPISIRDTLPKRVYEKQTLYPNGLLEFSGLFLTTKYFGEFTDNNIGLVYGISTRYLMSFLPEIGIGARLTTGYLKYDRRYKERFGDDWKRQYPASDFPTALTTGIIRKTKLTAFEPLFFLNLFPRQRLNYYLFAGYSVLLFTPQDIDEDPLDGVGSRLHYKTYKDEDGASFHLIGGFGIDYYISRKVSIGLQAAYRNIKTDILDGYAQIDASGSATNPDAYAEFGLKLSYYFFGSSDTDGDGISDLDEEKLGTNPFSADTDGDGVSDFDEIYLYKTDPFSIDSDNDGISDSKELFEYRTNPLLSDTDSDGLSDSDELFVYKTNPRVIDSDGDTISDADEIKNGTNPLNIDTDSDTLPDNLDKCPVTFGFRENEGCPIPPSALIVHDTIIQTKEVIHVIEKGQSYTPYGINFKRGKSEIEVESEPILDGVVKWLQDNPTLTVEVRGHTDSEGAAELNLILSQNRAESVRNYLVKEGIDPTRLSAKGFGKNQPVADNNTLKGKAQNRRIEFYVKNK